MGEHFGPNVSFEVSISLVQASAREKQTADHLLTVEDVADRLRLARGTVREHMRTGKIKAHKKGRRWYTTSQTLLDADS